MLYIFRLIIIMTYGILVCVLSPVHCPFNLRSPKHVVISEHMSGRFAPLFDLKVECRKPADTGSYGNAAYTANHQNSYDMVTASNVVQPPIVTVGKKSLLRIPFFGQLYWLTGNLLINRSNRIKVHGTIAEVVNHFKKRRISTWMFPEGACSRGRDLLPLKTGAFHAAVTAGVPIILAYVSTISSKINLNRLYDSLMIVGMLPPVDVSQYDKDQIRELVAHCRSIMERKVTKFGREITECGAAGKA